MQYYYLDLPMIIVSYEHFKNPQMVKSINNFVIPTIRDIFVVKIVISRVMTSVLRSDILFKHDI